VTEEGAEGEEGDEGEKVQPEKADGEEETEKPKKKKNKKKKVAKEGTEGEEGEKAEGVVSKPKRVQKQKVMGPPSTTKLFVKNLPSSFKSDDVKAIFEGYRVKSVKLRTFFRSNSAVVSFEDEGEQKKALAELGEVEVNGKRLQIRVANEMVPVGDETPAEAAADATDETPAPAE